MTHLSAEQIKAASVNDAVAVLESQGILFEREAGEPLAVNLNDALLWGCSDSETLDSPDDALHLFDLWSRYGWCGVLYWAVEVKRGGLAGCEFPSAIRAVLFVLNEERIRSGAGESASGRAYARATYEISDNLNADSNRAATQKAAP